jgi:vacuolar-type H+-ATPase subunit E/Vma4
LFYRVIFREEKLKEKEELKKQALEEAIEAEKEKERRLDKLREQVHTLMQSSVIFQSSK